MYHVSKTENVALLFSKESSRAFENVALLESRASKMWRCPRITCIENVAALE
jgi:hypothetical protein